jgi:hypothetical protein
LKVDFNAEPSQVKSPLGDKNTILLDIDITAEYDAILSLVKDAFFPSGNNPVTGALADYTCEMVNGRNENVFDIMNGSTFTIPTYILQQMVPGSIRLYLLCTNTKDIMLASPDLETRLVTLESTMSSAADPDPEYLPDPRKFSPTSPSEEIWIRRPIGQTTEASSSNNYMRNL